MNQQTSASTNRSRIRRPAWSPVVAIATVIGVAACGGTDSPAQPVESASATTTIEAAPTAAPETSGVEAGPEPTETPAPTEPPRPRVHVSLGSSFAAGTGAGDALEPVCRQGSDSYARIVATQLELELIDASCGSATIDNIVDTAQTIGDEERPPQIEAIPSDAAYVTITVGGNDVGYILNFYLCAAGCPAGLIDGPDDRADRFDDLADELADMLEDVQDAAPEAHIILVAYPRLLDGPTDDCEGLANAAEFHHDIGERLQQAFLDAVAETGVTFIDAYKASAGHGVCQPAENRWIEGIDAELPAFAWHPNSTGTAAIAELVAAAMTP